MKEELQIIETALNHAHAQGAFTNLEPLRTVQWWSALNALKQRAQVEEQQRAAVEEADRMRQAIAGAQASQPQLPVDEPKRRKKQTPAAVASSSTTSPCPPCEEKAKAEAEQAKQAASEG